MIAPVHICEPTERSLQGEGSHVEPEKPETFNTDAEQSDNFESDYLKDTFIECLAQFYLGLEVIYLVPASTITEIANKMRTLVDIQQEYTVGGFTSL